MNSVKLSILGLKYQRFKPFGCTDIGIRKFKFAAKTQFLYKEIALDLFVKLQQI